MRPDSSRGQLRLLRLPLPPSSGSWSIKPPELCISEPSALPPLEDTARAAAARDLEGRKERLMVAQPARPGRRAGVAAGESAARLPPAGPRRAQRPRAEPSHARSGEGTGCRGRPWSH